MTDASSLNQDLAAANAAERAEIAAERAEIAALRAALEEPAANGHADPPVTEVIAPAPAEKKPPVWPHQTSKFKGLTLQYRTISDNALMALGMATSGGSVDPQMQMRIFSAFLANHLSPASLEEVLIRMSSPDSEIQLEDVINHITPKKTPEIT